jgi:hypothetical protein
MAELNALKNMIVWSDIPVSDLGRASTFYEDVLGLKVARQEWQGMAFGVLEHTEGNGGCLIPKGEEVSASGMLVYFNVDGRIQEALSRVEPLGGTVVEPLHPIGPHGFRAIILDSEGNRIALHSTVAP